MKKFLIAIVVMFTIGVTSAQSKEKLEQKFEQLEKKLDETHKEYEAKLDKYHKDLSKNEKIDDSISDEDLEKLEIDDEFSDKRHNTPKGKDEDDEDDEDDENDNDDKDDDELVSKKDLEDFENFDKNISVKEKMKIFVETHEEGKKEIGDVKDTDFFDDKQPHKEIAKVAVQEKEYMKFLEKYDNEINKIHNEMYKVAKKYIAEQ